MPDFRVRSNEIEIMDDLNFSGPVMDQTLKELEVINTLLGGNHVTLDGLKKLIGSKKTVTIVDVGCGGGDMLRLIRKWCCRRGVEAKLIGIDANPAIVGFARNNSKPEDRIDYHSIDIFSEQFNKIEYDILVGTLFFHHFSDEQLIMFFRNVFRQSRMGFVINDIHRHWFAYHSIKWLTRLFSKSKMVQNDGPVSVLRAFRKSELERILKSAGITKYTIRWMWAFRWQVIVSKQ